MKLVNKIRTFVYTNINVQGKNSPAEQIFGLYTFLQGLVENLEILKTLERIHRRSAI